MQSGVRDRGPLRGDGYGAHRVLLHSVQHTDIVAQPCVLGMGGGGQEGDRLPVSHAKPLVRTPSRENLRLRLTVVSDCISFCVNSRPRVSTGCLTVLFVMLFEASLDHCRSWFALLSSEINRKHTGERVHLPLLELEAVHCRSEYAVILLHGRLG